MTRRTWLAALAGSIIVGIVGASLLKPVQGWQEHIGWLGVICSSYWIGRLLGSKSA